MPELHPNCRVWIYSTESEGVFGDGKLRLLEEIDRQGSLSEAAKVLGISYRKAWGDLKKAETCIQVKLIEKIRGGKGGGRTTLTEEGQRLIDGYKQFRASVTDAVENAFETLRKDVLSK